MLLLLALLITATLSTPARAGDCCSDPIAGGEGTVLFLDGPDTAPGDLVKDYPSSSNYDSVTINPDAGLLTQDLGQWVSEPLVYDWTVDSLIEVQIPAWGNGQSISTEFFVEVFVDGESQGVIETADDGMMYMYMYWLGNASFSFTVEAGQTFGMGISVIENGPGGELRWGTEEAIAQIWIRTDSVVIEVEDVPMGRRHESQVNVFSHWGKEDIDAIDMLVIDLDQMNGGPIWNDIVDNATLYETSDSLTVDWDDSEAGDGHRVGYWVWEMPNDAPERLEVVGFANDGGLLPTFTSDSATKGQTTEPADSKAASSSSSEDEIPWSPIVGFMVVAGLGIAGYQKKVMDHDIKRIVAVAGTVMVVGILVMAGFYSAAFSSEKQEAPNFELQTIDDETVALKDLEDKVVVLSFSGIYCSFCTPQLEEMVKVREEFRDNDDVFFLSVNIMAGDDDSDWREFRNDLGANWAFAMDNDGMVAKFKITSMPVIIMIDKDGDIVYTNQDSLLKAGKFGDKIEAAEEGEATGGVTFTGGSLMFAFFVGVTAFFAPCAFPLLPGFMTYQLGQMDQGVDEDGYYYKDEEKDPPGVMKGLKMGVAALIGISAVMVVFALLGWLLEDFIQSNMNYYTVILGVVIVALGVIFLLHIPLPTAGIGDWIRSRSFYTNRVAPKVEGWLGEDASVSSRHLGVMAYGAGYASASMGCHGPIFIAVVLIGLAGGFMLTLEMVLLYALGMGICMIVVCILVAMAEDTLVEKLQDKLQLINKISGLFLIVAGIWIFWFGYQAFL